MPATRSWGRRKSSLGLVSAAPAKPGIYGIQTEPSRLTFCPNVTPFTFKTESELDDMSDDSPADDSSSALFPPSSTPAPAPSRRRQPPGKRRSLGYIPRPPNAFMLFRADFVKQKHVPNSIETNHSSLSKIIGSCWRSLPAEEKAIWERRAKAEKAEHKRKYPEYRFRPVHNKNKKAADGAQTNKKMKTDPVIPSHGAIEALRTEREGFIAQCLLDGLKGDPLKEQVRQWDDAHGWVEGAEGMGALDIQSITAIATPAMSASTPTPPPAVPVIAASASRYPPRRSSSVPLPNDFVPFLPGYQPPQQYFAPHVDNSYAHWGESSAHGVAMDLAGFSASTFIPSQFSTLHQAIDSSRPPSPSPTNFDVGSISRQQRMLFGGRRASSAQAFVNYGRPDDSWNTNWGVQGQWMGQNWQQAGMTGSSPSTSASSLPLQQDGDDLPEADTSLFQPGFAFGASSISQQQQASPFEQPQQCNPFEGYNMGQADYQVVVQNFHQEQQHQHHHIHNPHNLSLAPVDTQSYSPLDTSPLSTASATFNDNSYPSTSYSGSPPPSERDEAEIPIHAPQPRHLAAVDDVDMNTYMGDHSHEHQPQVQDGQELQNQMHNVVESHEQGAFETSASVTTSDVDPAMVFTDLWKGLSSSSSFAVAMGFPLDSVSVHRDAEGFTYQSSSSLEGAIDLQKVYPAQSVAGESKDDFDEALRAQHHQLALESGC